jgi:kynurenine formamidase
VRETFELLGRRMTVLDLSRPADSRRPAVAASRWRVHAGPVQTLDGPSAVPATGAARGIPLRWSMGDGVVLDLRDRYGDGTGTAITERACREQLDRIEYQLKPYDVVLLRVRPASPHARLDPSALAWIVEQGIRVIGLDTAGGGIERSEPLAAVARSARRTGHDYYRIDGLCNLNRIPVAHGFTVIAVPVLSPPSSGHASRVVALFDGV